jgi:hypothetical protein
MPLSPSAYAVEKAFQARPDLKDAFRHNARLLFALQLRFDIEDVHAVAREALVDGPDDKACDLVYLDREVRKLVVAQGYEAADPGKGATAKTSKAADLNTAAAWLFSGAIEQLSERLQPVAQEVRVAIGNGEVDAIEFWYVHNRPESQAVATEMNTVEKAIRNALTDKFAYDPSKIPQEVIAIEVGMNKQEEWYRSLSAPILVTEEINFKVPGVFAVEGDNWKAVVTAIQARALYDLYQKHKADLFSANYRDFLGSARGRRRQDINGFIQTSADQTPGKFWVFNNGVSAIVNGFEVDGKDSQATLVKVRGLSIVNGAQTTGSIGSLPKPPDDRAYVPARFIYCTDGDTIADIVRFNNSQNPLMPADYKSNDEVQRRLREEFTQIPKSKYTGGRRGLPVDRIAPPGELMPSDTCAQALASFHQRPDIAYHRKADIWQEEQSYREYFSEKTTARHIVFAYSLLKSIEERKKRLRQQERAEHDLSAPLKAQFDFLCKRGATVLLAAAVARGLESVLGKHIPNPWKVSFDTSVGPVQGIGYWDPIVEALNPFWRQLEPSAREGVRNEKQVRQDIDQFCSIVESVRDVHKPTFQTFAMQVTLF